MILAFTGHRPPKIGGYGPSPLREKILQAIIREIRRLNPTAILSGGALGIDTDAAIIAYKMHIPYVIIAPCREQGARWPRESQRRYLTICERADETFAARLSDKAEKGVIYTHDGPYPGPWCMQQRNIQMVDYCDILLAIWDGSNGGTANCVRYADSIGKPKIRINPKNL